jgi:hypothetical protein
MNAFLTAQDAFVTILVPDVATDYYWRLVDQEENVLIPAGDLQSVAGQSEIQIQVPAASNTLEAGAVRALRVIEAYFVSPAGTTKTTFEYVIEAEHTLVVNSNTFQTYGEAVLCAYELFGLNAWSSASKADRSAALVAARRNIGQLRFRYLFDAFQDRIENSFGVSDITMISQSTWNSLPADFVAAIKRAQVIEADYLLAGGENPVDVKRRMGIVSETIGESSMFMRSARQLEMAVCRRAMKELAKYTIHRIRTTRS